MVRNIVLSRYNANPPPGALGLQQSRIIPGGPIYTNILDIIDLCGVTTTTVRCIQHLQTYAIDDGDLRNWITLAVKQNSFINSQWCSLTKPHIIAACDAYEVNQSVSTGSTTETIPRTFYVKFFVAKTGNTIVTVSFHPSYNAREEF
jgi:hypothetical protein